MWMKFKMAAMTGLTGTFDHRTAVVLVTQIFFLESTNMIKPKLYINGQWMVTYKVGFYIWIRNHRWVSTQNSLTKDTRGNSV